MAQKFCCDSVNLNDLRSISSKSVYTIALDDTCLIDAFNLIIGAEAALVSLNASGSVGNVGICMSRRGRFSSKVLGSYRPTIALVIVDERANIALDGDVGKCKGTEYFFQVFS